MSALKYRLTPYAQTNENHMPRLRACVDQLGPPQARTFTASTRDDTCHRDVAFCEHFHRSLVAAWKCSLQMLRHFQKDEHKR